MLKQLPALITACLLFQHSNSLLAEMISFGSPAPEFNAAIIQGEPLPTIAKGVVHVIEFSGTTCVPCIKLIPTMNALEEEYPDVIFVSVFCEQQDDVKRFLEGPGKAMAIRVAVDQSNHMRNAWLDASGVPGIPQAFIIDRTGTIAWFGHADETDFEATLGKIIDGTYDRQFEQVRMELKRRLAEHDHESIRWVKQVNEVAQRAFECETAEESIELLDKSLSDFAGSPERISLQILKLHFYKTLSDSREQAYEHALSLAVDAINEPNPNHYVSACNAMLSHAELALPENQDPRFADLALLVLHDTNARKNHIKLHPDSEIDYQTNRLAAIAKAHHIRGERQEALEHLEKAIENVRSRDMEGKPVWWIDQQKRTLERLESSLAEWMQNNKAAETPMP